MSSLGGRRSAEAVRRESGIPNSELRRLLQLSPVTRHLSLGLRYTVVISFLIIVFSLISGKLIEMLVENERSPGTASP